jgi:AraC family transcriptional regulator
MTEALAGSRPAASQGTGTRFTTPVLYLSSLEAGWEGLAAQAFHEPPALEGWLTAPTPDASLVLFAGGAMRMEWRHANGPWQAATLGHGDLNLSPGGSHAFEVRWHSLSDAPAQTLHLHLSRALMSQMAGEVLDCDPAHLVLEGRTGLHDPLLMHIGFALWRELEQPASVGRLYAQAAAQMLAMHLLRHYATIGSVLKAPSRGLTPQQMGRVVDFMRAHLAEDLSLDALAQQAGYSAYYFARLFHQTVGESPHQFVLRQRIGQAQRLLKETDMPLAQIAVETGFAGQSHLTGVFKQHFGLTPRAYRRND